MAVPNRIMAWCKIIFFMVMLLLHSLYSFGQNTDVLYLSGTGYENTVDWEFQVTGGRRSGEWTTIPVPSHWEFHGFGTYNYGHDEPKADEQGLYRYRFTVPVSWRDKTVRLFFDGSMTDTDVFVNGATAGDSHQGAFYRFDYDVTKLLNYGAENLVEVTVSKMSTNHSVNEAERQADFWVFGGIYRPVYIEAYPKQHISRIALDARADGTFRIEVYLSGVSSADEVNARIYNIDGSAAGEVFRATIAEGRQLVRMETKIDHPRTWSPEFPNRYRVVVQLKENDDLVHTVDELFGFRTVDVRPRDGIYVNGIKVRMKGVNRHTSWPDAGRTTNRSISELDVNLMKDMNMNAVRMSHYPPDTHFLDVCDSLGLFVLDELTGWQDAYDTEIGEKLVGELVTRDVNHPSVIMWVNGNEGGFNRDLDDDYAQYDPQNRVVLHPWENFNGIDTAHYLRYNCCTGSAFNGQDIFMPTEFLHGLYDGGHGAGLDDYWNLMLQNPRSAGGFLWVLADEGIVRTDLDGIIDTDGNHAPDGIVGPYREKEGSFYTIKEIWSPVYIEETDLTTSFDGRLRLENRFHYTSLEQCTFNWQLVTFPEPGIAMTGYTVSKRGTLAGPQIPPQSNGILVLILPDDWATNDALILEAVDSFGRNINTWTWMIHSPKVFLSRSVRPAGGQALGYEEGDAIVLRSDRAEVHIDKATGTLKDVFWSGEGIALRNGPRLLTGRAMPEAVTHYQDGDDYVVEATYTGNLDTIRWRMMSGGWLKLEFQYHMNGEYEYMGLAFDYPEDRIKGMTWLGQGPYHVWKNRTKGVTYNVWQKAYNDGVAGESWSLPAFKGYHANLYWVTLDTAEQPITIVTETEDLYLGMLRPHDGSDPQNTLISYPEGDISFLQGISPIGTKFHPADHLGPESQPNYASGHSSTFTTVLYFFFGPLPNDF